MHTFVDKCSSKEQLLCIGLGWFPDAPGGLDRYVYELTHNLVEGGSEVELCAVDLPDNYINEHLYLNRLAVSKSSIVKRLRSSRHQFQERSLIYPNAINIHFALYSLPLLDLLPPDIPRTFTFHGPWAFESKQEGASFWSVQFKYWVEQCIYRRCDRFIVLSKAFGKILNQDYNIPWHKIHVIPGGVDTQRFQNSLSRRQAREKLGWPQDRFILFTPRRLVNRMGLDKLLSAIAQLKEHKQDLWLAIAGKGPLREALEKQATELDLGDQINFLGFLPDEQLPLAYQAADLTVMPSQSLEGFGLVLLESLASGTPTLCTPVGGMPEVITDFSPELITASPSAKDIAATLAAILTEDIKLPDRNACRDYAFTHFNWPDIANRVKQVLLN